MSLGVLPQLAALWWGLLIASVVVSIILVSRDMGRDSISRTLIPADVCDQAMARVPVQVGYPVHPQNRWPVLGPRRAVRIAIGLLQVGHAGDSAGTIGLAAFFAAKEF